MRPDLKRSERTRQLKRQSQGPTAITAGIFSNILAFSVLEDTHASARANWFHQPAATASLFAQVGPMNLRAGPDLRQSRMLVRVLGGAIAASVGGMRSVNLSSGCTGGVTPEANSH